MKRLVLKESAKNLLITLAFLVVIAGAVLLHIDRVEKINSGDFELVYQYGGDI